MIKDTLHQALRRLGYVVRRACGPMDRRTMDRAFGALVRRGRTFKTVIDIGASNGQWSEALAPTDVIIIECYNFRVAPERPIVDGSLTTPTAL